MHLEEQMGKDEFTQRDVAASISQKIGEYWDIMDNSSITSAILDPRIKLSIFSEEKSRSACIQIKTIFETYQENSFNISSSPIRTSTTTMNSSRQYFTQLRQGGISQTPTFTIFSTPAVSELDRYLSLEINEETDPLLWWQAHAKEYPIVSKMARDYLSIQATSVPSEQAFSVAGNTISKTRNRLLPETARACLCMKSWIINEIGE
jgi:hypothetical protein